MAHKRYRNPNQGYERSQTRQETRSVVEEELFGTETTAHTPQSGIAARMAEGAATDTASALGALDLDGLVSHEGGETAAQPRAQRLEDLRFDNVPADATTAAAASPAPTADASAQERRASRDTPIEQRRVTQVRLGAANDRKQRRGGLVGFVNRLLGR